MRVSANRYRLISSGHNHQLGETYRQQEAPAPNDTTPRVMRGKKTLMSFVDFKELFKMWVTRMGANVSKL